MKRLFVLTFAVVLLVGCTPVAAPAETVSLDSLPAFDGTSAYVEINGNQPYFSEADYTTEAFETYSELDSLGRCGVAYANICKELMPEGERGEIGQVKPSGWHTVRYDDLVDGKYLYNRCHLIGWQLAGENANKQNLITGTRYMNVIGMLPFENEVDDYVDETGNHVLYRVTPVFEGDELVARGVLMEAYSVEDNGKGITFCVFCYNAQPGVCINYETGESWRDGETAPTEVRYILNTNSKKFHLPDCDSVAAMSEKNKQVTDKSRDELIDAGYSPCGFCNP